MPKKQLDIIAGRNFEPEFVFSASRSSGPGGQHVNKVSTRIELRFNIPLSQLLGEEEKALALDKLHTRVTKEGILILVSQSERSQFDNKTKVIEQFYRLLGKALTPVKKRTPTRPTASSKNRRLETKHVHAEKKKRRNPGFEEL
jgi:ribosome-associated protein